jgi:cysteine-rich repeat protein
VIDTGELCDDGNVVASDGCSGDCQSSETCGNGYVDLAKGEQCDDGNLVNGDGCQASCKVPFCGDGIQDPGLFEDCDNGALNANVADLCRTTCRLPRCGDSVLDSNEVCDDGNQLSADGCSFDCKSNETCGNGYLDPSQGEQCDDGDS